MISFKLRNCVDVSFESSINNVCTNIYHVRHNWLALSTIPRNIAGLSKSVSVCGLVILMVDWSLSSSPLSMSIRNGRILRKHSGKGPVEQVWIVN